jgi:hypothetical protein
VSYSHCGGDVFEANLSSEKLLSCARSIWGQIAPLIQSQLIIGCGSETEGALAPEFVRHVTPEGFNKKLMLLTNRYRC